MAVNIKPCCVTTRMLLWLFTRLYGDLRLEVWRLRTGSCVVLGVRSCTMHDASAVHGPQLPVPWLNYTAHYIVTSNYLCLLLLHQPSQPLVTAEQVVKAGSDRLTCTQLGELRAAP
jgi:hypothetical protein